MSHLFPNFATASAHARDLAISSNQVVEVLSDEDQWAVHPMVDDPTEWLNLIQDEYADQEPDLTIERFLEYEATNDDSFD